MTSLEVTSRACYANVSSTSVRLSCLRCGENHLARWPPPIARADTRSPRHWAASGTSRSNHLEPAPSLPRPFQTKRMQHEVPFAIDSSARLLMQRAIRDARACSLVYTAPKRTKKSHASSRTYAFTASPPGTFVEGKREVRLGCHRISDDGPEGRRHISEYLTLNGF